MVQFIVNGTNIQLLGPIPDTIISLQVRTPPMRIAVHNSQIEPLKKWLNKVIDNVTSEYVEYQGVLIPTAELKKFTDV